MTNSESIPLPAPTALIIDDNWFNRDIARTALESKGFVVIDTEFPTDGVGMLESRTFDLLVLDLQMPILDGREVLHLVRPNPLHKEMNIVVVTAHPQMETPDVADLADYVMYKPINVMEFALFAERIKRSRISNRPPMITQ